MKKYDRLIFVSNSDTCRGPMAEAILKSKFLLSELEVESEDLSCSFRSRSIRKQKQFWQATG